MAASRTRTERDSLGEVEVPADRMWGAQTERSRRNFPIGERRMPLALIHAYARVKRAAARANTRLGDRPPSPEVGGAIEAAAREVIAGRWDDEFPLSVWQTGSGTQTNMNLNEVIARRARALLGDAIERNLNELLAMPTPALLSARKRKISEYGVWGIAE